jgi:DNA-binding transcriptional regulator YiaG
MLWGLTDSFGVLASVVRDLPQLLLHASLMTGPECKELRQKLRIRQVELAWECNLDAGLVSKWEAGFARLRAPQVQIIQHYLAQRLLAAKERFAAMELPELDAAIEQVTR